MSRHNTWRAERQAALARGRTPWVLVSTMTEWAAADRRPPADSSLSRRARGGGADDCRPTAGVRPARGSARWSMRPWRRCRSTRSPAARDALVATHGRIVGATAEEVSAAVRWSRRARASADGGRAARGARGTMSPGAARHHARRRPAARRRRRSGLRAGRRHDAWWTSRPTAPKAPALDVYVRPGSGLRQGRQAGDREAGSCRVAAGVDRLSRARPIASPGRGWPAPASRGGPARTPAASRRGPVSVQA